jgi:hypothetical protein
MTRFLFLALLLTVLYRPQVSAAQVPANPETAPAKLSPAPSAILQPALDNLQQTLDVLRLDKWKTSGAIREETESNIASIHHDLENSLPSLLAAADASPTSVVQILPLQSNIGALYDVLLRVVAVGKLAAPGQQSAALEQAMTSLEGGRRDLAERLRSNALTQEKQVTDLKASLRVASTPPVPIPAPCPPPPAAAKKRKPRPKPAPTSTTPQ